MIHFEHPFGFLLLLLLPLYYILRHVGILKTFTLPLILSDWGGLSFSFSSKRARFASFLIHFLSSAAFLLAVVALCSPVATHQEKIYTSRGTEIMFVIDTSPSMAARDMQDKNRLEAAKSTILQVAQKADGASLGLVSLALDAALVVPVTVDHQVFFDRLDSLVIGEMGDGTAIGTGLCTAVYHLVNSKAPKKCIVLVTDGENNAGSVHPHTAAKLAKKFGINLFVVGLGTKGKVWVEYVDQTANKVKSGYLDSSFDENNLINLAMLADGSYFNAENTAALSVSLAEIVKRQDVVQSFRTVNVNISYGSMCLWFALAFFALSWVLSRCCLKEV
ncbi:MAG: VWA domain-containing protein [Treponemataceae bacterium]|nr:VWA domain-containing protein [Treponemataceae bacterium]